MIKYIPVSQLVNWPIEWVRGNDERLKTVLSSLRVKPAINNPIRIVKCGCGKSYGLIDGGHRITAAYQHYKKTGIDIVIPVEESVSNYQ